MMVGIGIIMSSILNSVSLEEAKIRNSLLSFILETGSQTRRHLNYIELGLDNGPYFIEMNQATSTLMYTIKYTLIQR